MSTNREKAKTQKDHRAQLAEVKQEPQNELDMLEAYKERLEASGDMLFTGNVEACINDRLKLAELRRWIAEYEEWPPEDRANIAAQKWLAENVLEICQHLRDQIEARCAERPSFVDRAAKKAAAITAAMFGSNADREKLAAEREAAEAEIEAAEATVSEALATVRMLEVSPSEQFFHQAFAAVERITFQA